MHQDYIIEASALGSWDSPCPQPAILLAVVQKLQRWRRRVEHDTVPAAKGDENREVTLGDVRRPLELVQCRAFALSPQIATSLLQQGTRI